MEKSKLVKKYSNFNEFTTRPGFGKDVDVKDLEFVIASMLQSHKRPFVRFMWVEGKPGYRCILYTGGVRLTGLTCFNSLVQYYKA